MTVKNLLDVVPDTQSIEILNSYGCVFKLDRHDYVTVTAFSDFVIDTVEARDADHLEVTLKMVPVKEA